MSRRFYRQSLLLALLVGVATLPGFALGQTAEEEKPASPPMPAGLRIFRRP